MVFILWDTMNRAQKIAWLQDLEAEVGKDQLPEIDGMVVYGRDPSTGPAILMGRGGSGFSPDTPEAVAMVLARRFKEVELKNPEIWTDTKK